MRDDQWGVRNVPALPRSYFAEARKIVLLRLSIQAPMVEESYWHDLLENPYSSEEAELVSGALIETAVLLAKERGYPLFHAKALYHDIPLNCMLRGADAAMMRLQPVAFKYLLGLLKGVMERKQQVVRV